MADRFPLIYNPSAGQIQEIASGDNLDLTGNSITGAGIVTATTFSGNLTGNATGLSGTPNITVGTVTGNLSGNLTGAASTAAVLGINTTSLNSTKFYVSGNSASNVVAISTASTITIDMSTGNNFTVILDGNYTLGNPTNATVGQSGVVYIVQDGTGSRTLGVGTHWHFPAGTAPTLTTTANAVDVLAFSVRTSTSIAANAILDVKATS
jgi:hypothetical protein